MLTSVIHLIAFKILGKIILGPCRFKMTQVPLGWPNRQKHFIAPFKMQFLRSIQSILKSTLDRGLPRCKNLRSFPLFFSYYFSSALFCWLLSGFLYSLFEVNCEFHRFLHQGKDEHYNTLKNDSNVCRRKPSLRVPELGPGATYSGFNKFHSLFKWC